MERKGIAAAGNFIIDRIKIIDQLPHREGLGNILSEASRNGGSSYNVLKDLAKLGVDFPLKGIGRVGRDELGQLIIDDCQAHGIDTAHLVASEGIGTSYTDVMSEKTTGKRTFFHFRGANSQLSAQDFPLGALTHKVLHLGYLLLLDELDQMLPNGRTIASVVLEEAQKHGLITSIDLVSEASDRFSKIVPPSLPYTDWLFLNEYEAGKTTGLELIDGQGQLIKQNAIQACEILLKMGVKQWVILHHAHGCIAMSKQQQLIRQPRLNLPAHVIKGSAGAGDAFAAGVLAVLHEGGPIEKALEIGTLAAASSLFDPGCSESILPLSALEQLKTQYNWI